MAFMSATCPDSSSFFMEYKDENGLLRKSCMASDSAAGPSPSSNHHHVPYATVLHGLNASSTSFMNQEGSTFDFGELEEAIARQVRNDEAQAPLYTGRPAATLEMFPSWPIRHHQTPRGASSKSVEAGGGGGGESTDSGSQVNTATLASNRDHQTQFEPESPISKASSSNHHHHHQGLDQNHLQFQQQHQLQKEMGISDTSKATMVATTEASKGQLAPKPNHEKRKGPGSPSENKHLDAKTLRRLAQNREAARKSRLRKKAYVQQLESSRIKLTQLEQDLQSARAQGLLMGGCGGGFGNISSGAAIFDMEYSRWLEDDHRHMSELRNGVQAHLSDNDLRIVVDSYISHYDEIFQLKGVAAKSDVFHLITGMWASQAERCFLWMGGFRPSDLIKMLTQQLDPITEQQVMGICSLQHSSQQAEEALTQGLDQLHQSLIDTVAAAGPVVDGMQQMAVALGKLSNLEGFVRQADNLRQQTLHQLRRILTVRQAARCFLVIGEYYGRLRALSSLWASRPRESMMSDDNSCQTTTDLQMVHHQPSSHQNHFSSFSSVMFS